MNKNKIIYIVLIVLGFVLLVCVLYFINKNVIPTKTPISTANSSVMYSNPDFGFTFSLSDSWKGFSIINNTWEGTPLTSTSSKQTGTKLLIRNPRWTSGLPYEDIPVMVFTLTQWNSYRAGNFSVSAAPISATELGRNNLYVFALPPRWDFDYSEGYAEAQNIIKSNPLKTFNVQNNVSGKLNIDFICENARTYMKFSDATSANKFVSDCKEGKHPDVIERYKAQMGVKEGAAI